VIGDWWVYQTSLLTADIAPGGVGREIRRRRKLWAGPERLFS